MLQRGADAALERLLKLPAIQQIEGIPEPEQLEQPPTPMPRSLRLAQRPPTRSLRLAQREPPPPTPEQEPAKGGIPSKLKHFLPFKRPVINLPSGKKMEYPIPEEQVLEMSPAERSMFLSDPQRWLEDKDKWDKERLAYLRTKDMFEGITGIKVDPQTDVEELENAIVAALWVLPFPIKAMGGVLGRFAGKVGEKVAPETTQVIKNILSKVATKVEQVGKAEILPKKIKPEIPAEIKPTEVVTPPKLPPEGVKPPSVEAPLVKEPVPAVTPEVTKVIEGRVKLLEDMRRALVETDVPGEAITILPDGVALTGREFRGVGAFQHLAEDLPPVGAWIDAGAIRVAWEESSNLSIELGQTITSKQFARLSKEIASAKNVVIDVTDYTGETIKTIEGTPNIVRGQLRGLIPKAEVGMPATPKVTESPLAQKMLNMIAEQKKLRKTTTEMYKEARAPKFAEIEKILETPKGAATVDEVAQALKGRLPHEVNPQYTLSPTEIDDVYNAITQSSKIEGGIKVPEVYPTQKAVMRLIEPDRFRMRYPGEDVELSLRPSESKYLEKVWGKEFVAELVKDEKWLRMRVKLNNAFYEIYYNSLLSGKAQLRNLGSNLVRLVTNPIETAAGVVGELPLRAIPGYQRARYLGEVNQEVVGALGGWRDGVRRALHILKTGERYSEEMSKYELPERVFKGKIGYAINLPSIGMDAGDGLFKGFFQQGFLNKLAYRQAKLEKLKDLKFWDRLDELKSNPSLEMMTEVERLTNDSLFRANTKLSELLIKFRDFSVGGFQPLRPAAMFVRVPINVAGYGLARSPIGALNPKMWANIIKKDPQAADQIGRVMLGSAVAASLYTYAKEGLFTGSAPTSPAEKDRFYRAGKQPFSVRIGDTWVSYQQIPLLGTTLFELAQVFEAIESEEGSSLKKASRAVYNLAEFVTSQTSLVGLSDFFDALTDPERYAEIWIERTVPSLMPFSGLARIIAQGIDTTIRKPETIAEGFKALIPGLSKEVPARLTALGEETERETPWWSPINIGKVKESAVESELNRLKYNIGFVGKTIDTISLTPDQQFQYQQLAGQMTKAYIANMVGTAGYKRLSDLAKVNVIDSLVRKARTRAKQEMYRLMKKITTQPTQTPQKVGTRSLRLATK